MTKKQEEKLVTFKPAFGFVGYPFGTPVQFSEGIESIPVPEDYAQLMRDKGHVARGTQLHEPKGDAE